MCRPASDQGGSGNELVEALQRWQDFGAVWRVLERDSHHVTVGLFRCDGGEEVGRLTSCGPEVAAFLANRTTSEE